MDYKQRQERIENLSCKYFFQQKGKEILMFFGALTLLLHIPYWIGVSLRTNLEAGHWMISSSQRMVSIWADGLFIIIMVLICCGLFLGFAVLITKWIMSNEDKAKARAEKEVDEEDESWTEIVKAMAPQPKPRTMSEEEYKDYPHHKERKFDYFYKE